MVTNERETPQVRKNLRHTSFWNGEGYRAQLNDDEKTLYDVLLQTLLRQDPVAFAPGVFTNEEIDNTIIALLCEHCELFWFGGRFPRFINANGALLIPQYRYPITQTRSIQAELRSRIADILHRTLREGMGDYEKVLALHDWLCLNVRYVEGRDFETGDYQLDGALLRGECVCSGFSKAFAVLCRNAGVQCWFVNGTVQGADGQDENGKHAWNIVRIDDWYQHVDVTFDAGETARRNSLSRRFVGLSDGNIRATHTFEGAVYPSCELDQYNFERQGEAYFTDVEQVLRYLIMQRRRNERFIVVRMRMHDAERLLRNAIERLYYGRLCMISPNRQGDVFRITIVNEPGTAKLTLQRKGDGDVPPSRLQISRDARTERRDKPATPLSSADAGTAGGALRPASRMTFRRAEACGAQLAEVSAAELADTLAKPLVMKPRQANSSAAMPHRARDGRADTAVAPHGNAAEPQGATVPANAATAAHSAQASVERLQADMQRKQQEAKALRAEKAAAEQALAETEATLAAAQAALLAGSQRKAQAEEALQALAREQETLRAAMRAHHAKEAPRE